MNRFKISTRLTGLLATLCCLVLLVGGAGIWGMGESNEGMKSVYEDRVVPLKQIKLVSDMYAVNVVDTAHKVRDGAVAPQQGLQSLADARKNIQTQWSAYLATQLVPEETRLVEQFKPLQVKADAAVATLENLFRAGDVASLTTYAAKEMYPAIDPLQEVLGSLIQVQLDMARTEYDRGDSAFKTIRALVVGAALLGLLLAAIMGITMIRQISSALGNAVQIAGAVAKGDLTVPIHASGRDEITQLLQGLAAMRDNLAHVVADVRGNAEGVASASAQIASGNHDLSSRTEEQASALEETAASMEELNATVKQNADNARQANQLAMSASTVAGQGGAVVAEVVDTMKGINDSSKKIAEIISVIDGIAFQTNILALNAAVEAARAGEQGRGFAVVASEVRSLAGRSAEAAKEIKGLISTSVERVEQGTALVDKAGATMTEVVTAIRRVTDIMGEISAASSEQSTGVAQVGEAITQMDQVTQQNAALVEEMAAAAGSLSHQAHELVGAVTVFKLTQAQAETSATKGKAAALPVHRPVIARAPAAPARAVKAAAAPAVLGQPAAAQPAAVKTAAAKTAAAGAQDDWESF